MAQMLMASGSASAVHITAVAHAVDLAKEVIQSTPRILCEWSRCNIELNSWKSLQEVRIYFISSEEDALPVSK